MAEETLNDKQQRFVEEYIVDLNAAAAYRRAGYKATGDSVAVNASRLLTVAKVQEAIQKAMADRSKRVQMSADEVLQELKILGKSNVWHYQIDDRGNVTLAPDAPPESIRAVSSIKRKVRHTGPNTVEYETEIKLWDKNSALEKAGKHLGLFIDRQEIRISAAMHIVEEIVDASNHSQDNQTASGASCLPQE